VQVAPLVEGAAVGSLERSDSMDSLAGIPFVRNNDTGDGSCESDGSNQSNQDGEVEKVRNPS
jgi:hypothetical protein